MKNRIIKYLAALIFSISYAFPVWAFSGNPNDPDAGPDPQTPIDGWVPWIILFGFILGIYHLLAQKSALNETEKKL